MNKVFKTLCLSLKLKIKILNIKQVPVLFFQGKKKHLWAQVNRMVALWNSDVWNFPVDTILETDHFQAPLGQVTSD